MKHKITLKINGESVTAEVDSRLLLVHFIRENLDLSVFVCVEDNFNEVVD